MGQPEQSVEEWARTEQFPYPLRWGAVEDAVLDRRLPPLEDERGHASRMIIKGIVVLLAILLYGSGAIGLLALALGLSAAGANESDWWLGLAQVMFIASLIALVAVLGAWWGGGRRRGPWDLLSASCTCLAGAGAWLIGITHEGRPSGPGTLAIVAALAGAITVVVLLTSSRSHSGGRRRWSIDPVKDRRYLVARQAVLEILVERGMADELSAADRQQLKVMPLGTWYQVDEGLRERG